MSSWLPLAGQLTGLDFTYLDGQAQREDVRYNPATLTAMVRGGLTRRDDYEFSAVLPASTLKVGMAPYRRGRSQPEGKFLDAALEPWREASLAPMERVFSLAEYLRTNGRFSDGAQSWEQQFEAGHDPARLGDGFFEASQMVGDHEQYTAFLALAANRLGVPARAVVGAVPGPDGVVTGSDVTTWVEIRVEDGSWRILPSDVYLATRPPRRSEPPKQDPGTFVAEVEEGGPGSRALRRPTPQRDPLEEVLRNPPLGPPRSWRPWWWALSWSAPSPPLKWLPGDAGGPRPVGTGSPEARGRSCSTSCVSLGAGPGSARPTRPSCSGRGARRPSWPTASSPPVSRATSRSPNLVAGRVEASRAAGRAGWKGRFLGLGEIRPSPSACSRASGAQLVAHSPAPDPRGWQPGAGDGVPGS